MKLGRSQRANGSRWITRLLAARDTVSSVACGSFPTTLSFVCFSTHSSHNLVSTAGISRKSKPRGIKCTTCHYDHSSCSIILKRFRAFSTVGKKKGGGWWQSEWKIAMNRKQDRVFE